MRKVILLISILFLLIFTTITKNSTKKIEKEIYNSKENLRVLKKKYEMVLLEFDYLSSPKKLLEYQSKYFEDDLKQINMKNLEKIFFNENNIEVKKFIETNIND
tara:strand:+ start:106 stop:417 length:312 start_codon:yes stop_codon:yes gene_type:complete